MKSSEIKTASKKLIESTKEYQSRVAKGVIGNFCIEKVIIESFESNMDCHSTKCTECRDKALEYLISLLSLNVIR